MEVSFRECVRDLVRTEAARRSLAGWENRSYMYRKDGFPLLAGQQDEFRDRVKRFTHRRLFTLTTAEITDALGRTEHALGNLDKLRDERRLTEDAQWPFSFSYYLHALLEATGRIPLWQDLWAAAWSGEFRAYFRGAMAEAVRKAAVKRGVTANMGIDELERSAHWRLGKYYYSALRELYLFAALRERYGVSLHYHIFADVRLFVDGWTPEGVLLCLRLPNSYEPRKETPAWAPPGWRAVSTGVPFGGRGYGWIPTDEGIETVARHFLTAGAS